MKVVDCLEAAWRCLLSHPLRSALAALGIVIGVAATIAIAMVMQSLSASLNRQFEGMGARTLTVRADTSFEETLRGHVHRLRAADVDTLRRIEPPPIDLTPVMSVAGPFGGPVAYRGRSAVAKIFGTTGTYARLHSLFAVTGRFLAPDDDARHRRVCVIGEQTRRDLGLREHPEGEFMLVLGEWFKIVGVLDRRGSLFGITRDDDVLVPYQTALAFAPAGGLPDRVISFNAPDERDIAEMQETARRALRKSHQLRGSQADDLVVETAEELRRTYASLSSRLALGLTAVVGLSLVVSGIGILNIMLVSVTERTREIGIMKAIGARDVDILVQFLLEAVLLTLVGCAFGVLAGLGAGELLTTAMPDSVPAAMPWGACALAVASSAAVGLVFGVVPARRAAALAPIEALRYE